MARQKTGRMCTAEEVAHLCVYLASDEVSVCVRVLQHVWMSDLPPRGQRHTFVNNNNWRFLFSCSQPMSPGRSTSSMEAGDSKLGSNEARSFSWLSWSLWNLTLFLNVGWKWQPACVENNVLLSVYSHIIKRNHTNLRNNLLKFWLSPRSDCTNFISNKPSWELNSFLVRANPPDSHLPAAPAVSGLSEILTSHGTVCGVW